MKTTLTARIAWKTVVTTSTTDSILKSFVWISRDGFLYFGIRNSRHETKEDGQMGFVWNVDGDRKKKTDDYQSQAFGSCGVTVVPNESFRTKPMTSPIPPWLIKSSLLCLFPGSRSCRAIKNRSALRSMDHDGSRAWRLLEREVYIIIVENVTIEHFSISTFRTRNAIHPKKRQDALRRDHIERRTQDSSNRFRYLEDPKGSHTFSSGPSYWCWIWPHRHRSGQVFRPIFSTFTNTDKRG